MDDRFGNNLYALAMLAGIVIVAIDHLENQTALAQLISGTLVTLTMVVFFISRPRKDKQT
jgi:hypothetical protein